MLVPSNDAGDSYRKCLDYVYVFKIITIIIGVMSSVIMVTKVMLNYIQKFGLFKEVITDDQSSLALKFSEERIRKGTEGGLRLDIFLQGRLFLIASLTVSSMSFSSSGNREPGAFII